jgi:FMN phosphatase YigB (HAD superfamily)
MIAFGFDFDHTLGIDNGLERRAFAAYAAELGVPLSLDEERTRACIDGALARMRTGETDIEEMVQHVFRACSETNGASGARWREICFALVPALVQSLPGAVELLEELRDRTIPFAILTNGWTPLQQAKIVQALGAHTAPDVLVSDQLGAQKPARATFDALVGALRAPREDVWYVGDNPEGDVGGALAAGLRAVWFDWEGLRYPQNVPPPTLRIGALRELRTLVENTSAP